jgi:hypothetical protein
LSHFIFAPGVGDLLLAAGLHTGIYNHYQYPERAEAIQ